MKTIVYIDGYNLYYGRLKHTEYKWLNLLTLFEKHLIPSFDPDVEVIKVKYFTAPVKTKFSKKGSTSLHSQQKYHRALNLYCDDKIEIIEGHYSAREANVPIYGNPPNMDEKVKVWRLEEKKTDVNIALHLYRDASQNTCEQVVLCTNDTDLEPALSLIKQDFPDIKRGLVVPTRPLQNSSKRRERPIQSELNKLTDWTRYHIRDEELENSQLPEKLPTHRKPILRPDYW